jgi:hypothetical protein
MLPQHSASSSKPGKFVATVGVTGLVVVETDDALLITTLAQAQDVGKVVKYLDEQKLSRRRMSVDELFVPNIGPGLAEYLRATGED